MCFHTKGINYPTSATITKMHLEGIEIYIKNQSNDSFPDILKVFGLEVIPAYGEKYRDENISTYQKNKELPKKRDDNAVFWDFCF